MPGACSSGPPSATSCSCCRARPRPQRVALPGVSASRARQLLAGAIVAEAAMDLLGVDRLDICPWALREGLILQRLDSMG